MIVSSENIGLKGNPDSRFPIPDSRFPIPHSPHITSSPHGNQSNKLSSAY
ncbi:MAG: hypothetical protein F6K65_43800 [Moorea sp. SIO3C2]|nr:hypothetical protein [Moorena sp. SIO3C2]